MPTDLLCLLLTIVVATSSLPQDYNELRWGFEDDNAVDDHCKGWGSRCSANETCCSFLTCSKKKGLCSFLAGLWDDEECKPAGGVCWTNDDCCSGNCVQNTSRNWDFWEKGVEGHCADNNSSSTTSTTTVRNLQLLYYP